MIEGVLSACLLSHSANAPFNLIQSTTKMEEFLVAYLRQLFLPTLSFLLARLLDFLRESRNRVQLMEQSSKLTALMEKYVAAIEGSKMENEEKAAAVEMISRQKEELLVKRTQHVLLEWMYGLQSREEQSANSRQTLQLALRSHHAALVQLLKDLEKTNAGYMLLENEIGAQLAAQEPTHSPESRLALFQEAVQLRRQVYWIQTEQVKTISALCLGIINFESARFSTPQTEMLNNKHLSLVQMLEKSILDLERAK